MTPVEIIAGINAALQAARAIESIIDGFAAAAAVGEGFTEEQRQEILRAAADAEERIRERIAAARARLAAGGGE